MGFYCSELYIGACVVQFTVPTCIRIMSDIIIFIYISLPPGNHHAHFSKTFFN